MGWVIPCVTTVPCDLLPPAHLVVVPLRIQHNPIQILASGATPNTHCAGGQTLSMESTELNYGVCGSQH